MFFRREVVFIVLLLATVVAPTAILYSSGDQTSKPLADIQKILIKEGYATVSVHGAKKPLKETGLWNAETRAAIEQYLLKNDIAEKDIPKDRAGLILAARLEMDIRPSPDIDVWRLVAWGTALASFLFLIMAAGFWFKGRLPGLLIDRRNRYSLSRLQMVAWTVLAIPTVSLCLVNNALVTTAGEPFPELAVEWTLFALMGISIGSFVIAPMALSVKAQRPAEAGESTQARKKLAQDEGTTEDEVLVEGQLVKKAAPEYARITDLLKGEETGNAGTLDLARFQMLALTAVVWCAYALMLYRTIADADQVVIGSFPAMDDTLLALILVSHAGYIVGKVSPNSAQATDAATRSLSRLLSVISGTNTLIDHIKTALAIGTFSPAEERQLKLFDDQANRLLTEAEKLRTELNAGQEIGDATAVLEGQLTSLRAAFQSLSSDRGVPAAVNDASPDLVRLLKQKLAGVTRKPMSDTGVWTEADEAVLKEYLAGLGVMRDDLHPDQYRAFEEVLELIDEPIPQ